MLVRFFLLLRSAGVPVSITELMTLLEALGRGLGQSSAERFYHLARTCLVKDERYYDRFDRAFAAHFKGAEEDFGRSAHRASFRPTGSRGSWSRDLTDEEKAQIEALGGWDKLMETLKKRLRGTEGAAPRRQQVDRHGRHVARSARTATTRRACASARRHRAIAAP